MICQLSARSSNSVADLQTLHPGEIITLAEEVAEREDALAWDNMHEALARIHDLLAVMRVEALALGGVKRYNLPAPERMPRPGDDGEIPVVTPGEAARLMMAS
jgi:hypothetical protein